MSPRAQCPQPHCCPSRPGGTGLQDPPQPAPARNRQDLGQLELTVTQQCPTDQSPAGLSPQGAHDSPGGSGFSKQPSLPGSRRARGRQRSLLQAGLLLTISPFQPYYLHVTSLAPVYPVASNSLSVASGVQSPSHSGLCGSHMNELVGGGHAWEPLGVRKRFKLDPSPYSRLRVTPYLPPPHALRPPSLDTRSMSYLTPTHPQRFRPASQGDGLLREGTVDTRCGQWSNCAEGWLGAESGCIDQLQAEDLGHD